MGEKEKIKILILDDEKQFTEELSGFFVGSDYESFEANTAAEGRKVLQMAESENFIFIFLHD